ncbi:MAG: hypothetical protein IJG24_03440 [Selenomonadaceae bacterium]|nr:hypothetical protein [Selenomonadaceae bacterium]
MLSEITVPSGIKTNESGAFRGCNELTSVEVTFDEKRFIDGEFIEAGTEVDLTAAIKAGKEIDCFKLQSLDASATEQKGVYYVSADTTRRHHRRPNVHHLDERDRFNRRTARIFVAGINTNKLYAPSGCLVTVPESMVIEGDKARAQLHMTA